MHDCEPPQFSPVAQPHTPPLQVPPPQSASLVHTNAWHEPPQMLPAPQSLLVAHALALHLALLQIPSGH